MAAPQAAGEVLGRVDDAVTRRPLSGVTVRLLRGPVVTSTSQAEGRFIFKEVPEGVYTVEVEAADHLKAVQSGARVVLNKAASLEFVLVPTDEASLQGCALCAICKTWRAFRA